jgi:hypothetical protein
MTFERENLFSTSVDASVQARKEKDVSFSSGSAVKITLSVQAFVSP